MASDTIPLDRLDEVLLLDFKQPRKKTKERLLAKQMVQGFKNQNQLTRNDPHRTPWQAIKDTGGQDILFFCNIPFYIIRYNMIKDVPSSVSGKELISTKWPKGTLLHATPLWEPGTVYGSIQFMEDFESAEYIGFLKPGMPGDYDGYDWTAVREETIIEFCMPKDEVRESDLSVGTVTGALFARYIELMSPISKNIEFNFLNRLKSILFTTDQMRKVPQGPRKLRGDSPPLLTALPWRDMACFGAVIRVMESYAEKCILPGPQEPWSPADEPDSVSLNSYVIQKIYNLLVFCQIPSGTYTEENSFKSGKNDLGKLAGNTLAFIPPSLPVKNEITKDLYGNFVFVDMPIKELEYFVDGTKQGLVEAALRTAEVNASKKSDDGKNGFMTYAPAHIALADPKSWRYSCTNVDVERAVTRRLTEGYEFSAEFFEQYDLFQDTIDNAYTLMLNVALAKETGNEERLRTMPVYRFSFSDVYIRLVSTVMLGERKQSADLDECIRITRDYLHQGAVYDKEENTRRMIMSLSGVWRDRFETDSILRFDVTGPANKTLNLIGEKAFREIALTLYEWNFWFCGIARGRSQALAFLRDDQFDRKFDRDYYGLLYAFEYQRRILLPKST